MHGSSHPCATISISEQFCHGIKSVVRAANGHICVWDNSEDSAAVFLLDQRSCNRWYQEAYFIQRLYHGERYLEKIKSQRDSCQSIAASMTYDMSLYTAPWSESSLIHTFLSQDIDTTMVRSHRDDGLITHQQCWHGHLWTKGNRGLCSVYKSGPTHTRPI
ncbi:hypothetical protein CY34DRAFT_128931 [Suillus luteus UH-Slu-Lm8-n1]|uniref:Uncharacterized protein n=1 Tax=Suillus luteus UH-Slu-Lm8-n1 TaxID=930992 RepID=A0A0D0B262_9AGAM|nr:hypothetical protein CY34DRAFT_128931 [Suillus luteus UH-Slu-Lm8-n1]